MTTVPPGDGADSAAAALPGVVMIVEDDALIALDFEETLLRLGVGKILIAARVADALAFIADAPPDFALLNVGLHGETSLPIAERLSALAIPFAFVTGYGRNVGFLPAFADRPTLSKPFAVDELKALLLAWSTPPGK